jgi:hypothetical protein
MQQRLDYQKMAPESWGMGIAVEWPRGKAPSEELRCLPPLWLSARHLRATSKRGRCLRTIFGGNNNLPLAKKP